MPLQEHVAQNEPRGELWQSAVVIEAKILFARLFRSFMIRETAPRKKIAA